MRFFLIFIRSKPGHQMLEKNILILKILGNLCPKKEKQHSAQHYSFKTIMNKKISKELLNSATIHYRFNHKMECIHFKDIVYIKSDNSYSNIFLIEEGIIHKKMICKSLLSLEKILTPKGFLRCHKYFLVNSNKVDYFCSRTRMLSVC